MEAWSIYETTAMNCDFNGVSSHLLFIEILFQFSFPPSFYLSLSCFHIHSTYIFSTSFLLAVFHNCREKYEHIIYFYSSMIFKFTIWHKKGANASWFFFIMSQVSWESNVSLWGGKNKEKNSTDVGKNETLYKVVLVSWLSELNKEQPAGRTLSHSFLSKLLNFSCSVLSFPPLRIHFLVSPLNVLSKAVQM